MKFYLFLILKIFIALTNSQSQTNWYWQNPLPQGNDLNHIQFANNSTGFAVGNKGTFAKTTNGGENWSYNFQITGFNISSMAVINSNTIFISADKKIMRSTDSGIWWDTVGYSSYFAFSSLFFVDQNTGYSTTNNNFSEFGEVYKTTNGGSNWFHVNINSS
ncbi:MAG TPA: YCF48-related protein, partial [Ignavibacteria bacterium]|nr:YCF48-related protein [Ignavibacteria bacterium]